MRDKAYTKFRSLLNSIPLIIFFIYVSWWVFINIIPNASKHNFDTQVRYNFTDSYGLVALAGSITGFIISKRWGFLKSRFGKTLFYFSLGLLLQFLGQLTYALFYRIGDVYLAFPSVGDIPYLLSSVAYIFAVYNLLKVIVPTGSVFKPKWVLLTSIALTVLLGIFSYKAFLNIAIHDERGTIYQVLNVAYPLIQSIYFLLGMVALLQAKRIRGGRLFVPVALVLIALIIQYVADFNFLYQSYHDNWHSAASNDLFYVIAYGLMALAILMIDGVRRKVVASPSVQNSVEGQGE